MNEQFNGNSLVFDGSDGWCEGGYNYAITVRKTRRPIDKEHYKVYFDWLSDRGALSNVNFELTRGLHAHAEFWSPVELGESDWFMVTDTNKRIRGWNVLAVPMFYRAGWIKYSEKDILRPGVRFKDQISPRCPIPNQKLF